MNLTEWTNLLRIRNTKIRAQTPPIQTLNAGHVAEIQARLTTAGGNPALYDYPAGTTVMTAGTGNAASTVLDLGKHQTSNFVVVRIVTTVGATPTATYDIQGSNDQNTWTSLSFADSGNTLSYGTATFTITTATTVIKFIAMSQKSRYIRVNVTANTNVTSTIDITPL